ELKKVDHINFSKLQSFEEVTAAADNPDMIHHLEEVLMIWHKQIERMWQELDARITDAANESKDNVKYLSTLEKVCQPLYDYELVSMRNGIPNLINAIRMIHSVSRYYNTSERMTSLFIKVTNQMVAACRAYITDGGLSHVWNQETPIVIEKIKDCIFLLKEYQRCFHETKQEILENLGEKSFEVSEMYIFGKSEAFCRRLEKITEMINVVQTFRALSMSTIEGIDIMAIKFKNIYQSVQKKQYDILDPRKTEFDVDFVDFMAKIEGLEIYQIHKDDPPLARNMPPVAGKILWVRQLFRRINEPINYFHKNSNILTSPEGKAVVQLYNRVAYVLVQFEVVYHNAWMKEISELQYPLQTTVLVRHPQTGKFLVNFEPQIPEIVRETKCMIKLGLEVPEQAKKLAKIENKLKSNKLRLEVNDICEVRIDLILKEISNTLLIVLPVDDPIKVEDMLTSNEIYTKECAELLNHKSMNIEDAVQDLIAVFENYYEIKHSKKTSKKQALPGKEKRIMFEDMEDEDNTALHGDDRKGKDKEDEFKELTA
ncbi:hypothetical protein CIB84_004964, partial [Bambusicola thoracicus]